MKEELDATFKEDISIYFDENPHDGLLETHDVDDSLREKLKCLIFIPIVSQTYCDPKTFAWQNEFLAFRDFVKKDKFGLIIKLPEERKAHRILPVKIHDIDEHDSLLFEAECQAQPKTIDFIFRAPGVNQPLRSLEDDPKRNLYHTIYRDQINKVANAVKELIYAIQDKPVSLNIAENSEKLYTTDPQKKSLAVLPFYNIGTINQWIFFVTALLTNLLRIFQK